MSDADRGTFADSGEGRHFSPGFLARLESCCEMWCLQPEGRGGVLDGTSSNPMRANNADFYRFAAVAESW